MINIGDGGMKGIVSFNGIDVRRVGNELHCCCFLGKDKFFNRTISIKTIKEIYFEICCFRKMNDKGLLVIKTSRYDGYGAVHNNFHTPEYVSITEEESTEFVKKIKQLIRG